MVSDRMLKKYMDNDLNETRIVEKHRTPNDEYSFNFSRGLSEFFGGFFTLAVKKTPSNRQVNPLTNAALQCKEKTDIQNNEVKIITRALKDFNLNARFIVDQELKKQAILKTGFSQNGLDNEPPPLIERRDWVQGEQLLDELRELMNNYPKCLFEDNPCLEAIESYAAAREAHHEKILSVASVLLPSLSSLLNEAKEVSHLHVSISPK